MPMLIPLAAAAGSIAAGAAAVSTAMTVGATLAGGAMIAGGALTVIGTLSKNQKLTKIGGLLSLAGGVAGLASGAWTEPMSFEALRASELGSTDAVNAAMTSPSSSALAFTPVGGDPGSLVSTPQVNAPQAAGAPPDIPFVDRQALQPGIIASRPMPAAGTVEVGTRAAVPTGATVPGGEPSAFSRGMSNVNKWMGDNKELVKTGAGILEGSMGQASQQDLMEERIRQEEEYRRRRRAEMSASIIGLRMPTYQAPKG